MEWGLLRQRRLLPSKNEISSAKVAHLTRYAAQYGTVTNSVAVDIVAVRPRKREMVERQIARHRQSYKASQGSFFAIAEFCNCERFRTTAHSTLQHAQRPSDAGEQTAVAGAMETLGRTWMSKRWMNLPMSSVIVVYLRPT